MNRLFAFGCSFTQYWRWPTWADALGREFDGYENWGVCGGGNMLILNSLIECHQRNQITNKDTVAIMWTNTSREDRYVGNHWLAQGNVYWSHGSSLPGEYVRQFACERGYLIRDLAIVKACKMVLDSIGCQQIFFSMVPLARTNQQCDLGDNPNRPPACNPDVTALYQDALDLIRPSMYDVVFGGDWSSRTGIPDQNTAGQRDFHPTPTEHIEYLDSVYTEHELSQDTRDWMHQCEQRVLDPNWQWFNYHVPRNRL